MAPIATVAIAEREADATPNPKTRVRFSLRFFVKKLNWESVSRKNIIEFAHEYVLTRLLRGQAM